MYFIHSILQIFFPVIFSTSPLLLFFLLLFFLLLFFLLPHCYFLSCHFFSCYFFSVTFFPVTFFPTIVFNILSGDAPVTMPLFVCDRLWKIVHPISPMALCDCFACRPCVIIVLRGTLPQMTAKYLWLGKSVACAVDTLAPCAPSNQQPWCWPHD